MPKEQQRNNKIKKKPPSEVEREALREENYVEEKDKRNHPRAAADDLTAVDWRKINRRKEEHRQGWHDVHRNFKHEGKAKWACIDSRCVWVNTSPFKGI